MEFALGQWPVNYLPPWGGKFPGQLKVTNCRVLFTARRGVSDVLQGVAPEPKAVAAALDLGPSQVECGENFLIIAILKSEIDRVESACPAEHLNSCVSITLGNNGSVHVFEKGLLPVAAAIRAIREGTGVEK